MASHEFTEVITDKNYRPLPSEAHDLQLKAVDIAYHVMIARQHKHWQAASMLEARLGKLARQAEGEGREKVEGLQETLRRDMARRLRDNPVKLRSITV